MRKYIASLLIIGIIFIAISTQNEALNTVGDQYFFIKKQLIWLSIGVITFIVGSKVSNQLVEKYSLFAYFVSLGLLALVIVPSLGNSALGARRWLNLGVVGVQPSEIFKFVSVIFFSSLFSHPQNRNLKTLLKFLLPPLLLILLEPNFSAVVLISAIVFSLYYLSGGDTKSVILSGFVAVAIGLLLVITSPYRFTWLQALLNTNTGGGSYHSNQMILTLASGGLFGKGFANSDQKYKYLPKISTDSILAVIGEEIGFLGISTIIILTVLLVSSLFSISRRTTTTTSKLMCQGLAVWIGSQALVNMSAVSAILPLTGVTYPLVSYGGSSLVTIMFALGLAQNVYSSKNENTKNHSNHRKPSYPSH